MTCPKCKNTNVTISESVYKESQHRSFLWNLLWICLTGGLWIIWMLIRKKKEKTVREKRCVCQSCGYSWRI